MPERLWKSPKIAESVTVPKVLGDIFESLIGAIYVDSGCSLDETWRIAYRLMENEIRKYQFLFWGILKMITFFYLCDITQVPGLLCFRILFTRYSKERHDGTVREIPGTETSF